MSSNHLLLNRGHVELNIYLFFRKKSEIFIAHIDDTVESFTTELLRNISICYVNSLLFHLYDPVSFLYVPRWLKCGVISSRQLELRIRYFSTDIRDRLDAVCCDCLYWQIRHDFIHKPIFYHMDYNTCLGLVLSDLLRDHMQRDSGTSLISFSQLSSFVPVSLLGHTFCSKLFRIPLLLTIRRSFKRLLLTSHVSDIRLIARPFIDKFMQHVPFYFSESFLVRAGNSELDRSYYLIVCRGNLYKSHLSTLDLNKELDLLCSIEEITSLVLQNNCGLQINRHNGCSLIYFFIFEICLEAFIDLICTWYCLYVNGNSSLCAQYISPCLQKLTALRSHASIRYDIIRAKLLGIYAAQPGFYAIRRDTAKYNVYRIDICVPYLDTIKVVTLSVEEKSDGFHWLKSSKSKAFILDQLGSDVSVNQCLNTSESFATISAFLVKAAKHFHVRIDRCMPPANYDYMPIFVTNILENQMPDLLLKQRNDHIYCIKRNDLDIDLNVQLSGRFSAVYRANWNTLTGSAEPVVLKCLKKHLSKNYLNEYIDSVEKCLHWKCADLVTLFGVCLFEGVSLVVAWYPLGSLDEYLKKEPTLTKMNLMLSAYCISRALHYLHSKQLLHGSVCCRNVFVVTEHSSSTFQVVLADPGVWFIGCSNRVHWTPPEAYNQKNGVTRSAPADIWAFGTTLWQIFSRGTNPTVNASSTTHIQHLYNQGARLACPKHCDGNIYAIMCLCWTHSPAKRVSASHLVKQFNHIISNAETLHEYSCLDANLYPESNCAIKTRCEVYSNVHENCVESVNFLGKPTNFVEVSDIFPTMVFAPTNTDDQLDELLDTDDILPASFHLDSSLITLKAKIGSGHFGNVFQATLASSDVASTELVAVKTVRTSGCVQATQDLIREFSILKDLNHPCIVKVRAVVDEPRLMLVMEYLPIGSLLMYLQSYSSCHNQLNFSLDISLGMQYLSEKKIVHRDLAARNVLVAANKRLKIADFGLAQCLGDSAYYFMRTNRELPLRWYAPESIRNGKFSTKSDVWSYGVVLFEIFSDGAPPSIVNVPDSDGLGLLQALDDGHRLCCPAKCSVGIYNDLMWPCWDKYPEFRPDFEEISQKIEKIQQDQYEI